MGRRRAPRTSTAHLACASRPTPSPTLHRAAIRGRQRDSATVDARWWRPADDRPAAAPGDAARRDARRGRAGRCSLGLRRCVIVVIDQATKAWLVRASSWSRAARGRSATSSGSCSSQNNGALFGLFRDSGAAVRARVAGGHRAHRLVPRHVAGRSTLAVARPGPAAGWRHRQPDRSAAPRLRRRLRRRRASGRRGSTRSTSPTRRSARAILLLIVLAVWPPRADVEARRRRPRSADA